MSESVEIKHLAVARIRRNSNQPRKGRNAERYEAFKQSIKAQGVLQPILVRPVSNDPDHDYEVVAGETRWLASGDLGIETIPSLVKEMSDDEARVAAVTENVQRSDMTPIEEANAAAALLVQCENDHDEVMRLLGWNRSKLSARILLTHASGAVEKALLDGQIKLGHAELLCPLEHNDQDMVLAKIIEGNVGVTEARDRLIKLTRRLDQAVFDTAKCMGCSHNSSSYADLFDTSVGSGQCQNLSCWADKVKAHLDAAIEDAKAEYGTVHRADQVPANSYQIIATDGSKGVGQEQATACLSCASYGVILDTRNGKEGSLVGRYCFNGACHEEKVSDYQAAVKAATQPIPAKETVQGAAGATSITAAPKAKPASSKPKTLRTALRRVAHKAHVKLAHGHFTSAPAYGYAQAISSVVNDLSRDIEAGLADKMLKSEGLPARPSMVRERVKWIAELAQHDEAKLLAVLVQLSGLAFCRTVTNDEFDSHESGLLAGELISRHSLDPSQTFSVTREYLDILTKDELVADCERSGFIAAYENAHGKGAFKKLTSSKVKELAEAMLVPLDGFTWQGYLPAFLSPAPAKTADTSPSVAA
jgi:PRTRC genetic system ParB family protein